MWFWDEATVEAVAIPDSDGLRFEPELSKEAKGEGETAGAGNPNPFTVRCVL